MTSEEQRTIDRAIIDGDLVDAVRVYRTYTGADLPAAKTYVEQRSASLNDTSIPVAVPPPWAFDSSALSATAAQGLARFRGPIIGAIVCAVVAVVILGAVPIVIMAVVHTTLLSPNGALTKGLLSQFTIVHEPYYPAIASRIANDPSFRNALGTPIAIDDGHVFCNYVKDTSVTQLADCKLPVSGPNATGVVQVHVQNQPGSLSAGLLLRVGDRLIRPVS